MINNYPPHTLVINLYSTTHHITPELQPYERKSGLIKVSATFIYLSTWSSGFDDEDDDGDDEGYDGVSDDADDDYGDNDDAGYDDDDEGDDDLQLISSQGINLILKHVLR